MNQVEMFTEEEMGSDKAPQKLTDEQMISILITRAHWTTKEPWTQIAERLAELSQNNR